MPATGQLKFYDAHNHLQDERFGGGQSGLVAACAARGIVRMVVNGSCEADWPLVAELGRAHRQVLPSFGYHPWYLHERTPDWSRTLVQYLDSTPSAVGEIGLDRWKAGLDYSPQEEVFVAQLRIAAERNLPATLHCLRAWGRLLSLLQAGPPLRRGFLLHSYGGPPEMVTAFVKLGAYFGFPGYFLHPHKAAKRAAFKFVPRERLLVETDAPDQLPPSAPGEPFQDGSGAIRPDYHPLVDPASGKPINHPANLVAVYGGLARFLDLTPGSLITLIEANFSRLFGCS